MFQAPIIIIFWLLKIGAYLIIGIWKLVIPK